VEAPKLVQEIGGVGRACRRLRPLVGSDGRREVHGAGSKVVVDFWASDHCLDEVVVCFWERGASGWTSRGQIGACQELDDNGRIWVPEDNEQIWTPDGWMGRHIFSWVLGIWGGTEECCKVLIISSAFLARTSGILPSNEQSTVSRYLVKQR